MRRLLILLLCAVTLISLGGCTALYNREYTVTAPHYEQNYQQLDTDTLRATSFSTLKSAVLQLIRSGSEEAKIRLSGYAGDASHDIPQVFSEVISSDPYGAYAVDNMSHDKPSFINRYEATIYIKYRRSVEKRTSLKQAGGGTGLINELKKSMESFSDYLVVEMSYFDWKETDVIKLMQSLYYDHAYVLGFPEASVHLYPDSGFQRIIEIDFDYGYPAEVLSIRSTDVRYRVAQIMKGLDTKSDAFEKTMYLYETLIDIVEYDFESAALDSSSADIEYGDERSIYGALVGKRAVSEGYALAFKRLCIEAGIPSLVVAGKYDGDEYVWNMVELDGLWYHIDCASESIDRVLQPDTAMEANYRWDTGLYPVCSSESPLQTEIGALYIPDNPI